MNERIKDLEERRLNERASQDIERQKFEIAVASIPRLSRMLEEQVKSDVADFNARFGNLLEISSPDTTGYAVRVRVPRIPFLLMKYKFESDGARIVYVKQRRNTDDAPLDTQDGTVFIRGSFNQSCWYEHKGKAIPTTEELSNMLLDEIFEEGSR
jgi:hypothetical protein